MMSLLWHLKYGHLKFKSLALLKYMNIEIDLPQIDQGRKLCEGCIYKKQHRFHFQSHLGGQEPHLSLGMPIDVVQQILLQLEVRGSFFLPLDDYTKMMSVYLFNERG